ncbi:hypothetical protein HOY34_01210 [Xinfangfangia sp. D13-10-4-6]|uniref:hypothetical protein n=1 Tax=Pseudogemmobacter hezensis TaxID=2737662 RepID=UPI0015569D79|nr:hypothetical protein [Pseudogemmobacter hezensis]NPD13816.1 hypothetical protein [Pseudogemmobacter hezensis]
MRFPRLFHRLLSRLLARLTLAFSAGLAATLVQSQPAAAECLGNGCYSGLGLLILVALAYLVALIALLVLVILRKWRSAKILLLGAALVVVGLPLVTEITARARDWWVSRAEIMGEPPNLATRVPLLINTTLSCDTLCKAVIEGAHPRGIIALVIADDPRAASYSWLNQPPLTPAPGGIEAALGPAPAPAPATATAPVSAPAGGEAPVLTESAAHLAAQHLEYWYFVEAGGLARQALTKAERERFAANVDYLVMVGSVWGMRDEPFTAQDLWRRSSELAAIPGSATLRLALGAFPAAGDPDFARLQPDLLEVYSGAGYLRIPLILGENGLLDRSVAHPMAQRFRDAICQRPDGLATSDCYFDDYVWSDPDPAWR